jgi:hypothetical protein
LYRTQTVVIPNRIRSLGPSSFECTGTDQLIFEPDCIVSVIDQAAFRMCDALKSLSIPKSVECLSDRCFADCGNLLNVTFESDSKLTVIGPSALHHCMRLLKICIPRSVQTLGKRCFAEYWVLSSVTFEADSALLAIHVHAFSCCRVLESISLPASLESVCAPFMTSPISDIQIDPGNRHLSVNAPLLLDFAGTKLIQSCGIAGGVQIPETVKILGEFAFTDCESLMSISVPVAVETIARRCFEYCHHLLRVTFEPGSKLTAIEARAFRALATK